MKKTISGMATPMAVFAPVLSDFNFRGFPDKLVGATLDDAVDDVVDDTELLVVGLRDGVAVAVGI